MPVPEPFIPRKSPLQMNRIVYACDIGSVKTGKFAWVRADLDADFAPVGSNDMGGLLDCLKSDLRGKSSIALGFEAPLFMPVPNEIGNLGSGRIGEGSRSMFAQSGACAMALGCKQIAFILRHMVSYKQTYELTFDATSWMACAQPRILIWEAFVSGKTHAPVGEDIRDAATAACYFHQHQACLENASKFIPSHYDCFSLIGSVALWSGWLRNRRSVKEKCLVLKPDKMFSGNIRIHCRA